MEFYKKSFLSVFDWIYLSISIGLIVFIVLFVSLSERDYASLQSSINILSKSGETAKAIQEANRNLLLSESNFRIFINTGDVKYKNKFLNYTYLTIDKLKQIQQSGDGKRIDSIISTLRKNIQFSDIIEYLENLSDSVSKNTIKSDPVNYNGPDIEKIDKSMLEKYTRTDTVSIDSSIHTRKRNFLSRLFNGKKNDTVKINVTQRVKSDSAYEMKNSSVSRKDIVDVQGKKTDSLVNYIQRFYKNAINSEIKARQEIAEKDRRMAENNLFIIDNIDELLQQVIKEVHKEKGKRNKTELENASRINVFNLKQTWWISATILFAAVILLISLLRVFKKTHEINVKNDILKKRNDINLRLISVINHDIIAPLRFLNMISKNLFENSDSISEDLKQQAMSEIISVSEELEMITGNVLSWIKYQNQNKIRPKEDINMCQMIDEIFIILNPLAKQNKVMLENYLPPDLAVYQFLEPLRITLYNLILNAIKFSKSTAVIVNGCKTNNKLVVTVKDEGVGMTDEQIKSILNEDYIIPSVDVNMNKGNGLGFLIIKDLIHFMDARLSIQSEKNEGTTVTLTFF